MKFCGASVFYKDKFQKIDFEIKNESEVFEENKMFPHLVFHLI